VIYTGLVGTTRKYRSQTFHRLALPRTHLVWVHLVPSRYFLDRLVSSKRLKRHLRFKISCKPTSCRDLVFLRYPAEYTLTPCPIFGTTSNRAGPTIRPAFFLWRDPAWAAEQASNRIALFFAE